MGRSLLLVLAALVSLSPETQDAGIRPRGLDGRVLNLDFETGDLRDWKASGEAFQGQPIRGDTVARRRSDMRSEHQGEFWVGTYEIAGDGPQGTLVSAPFRVTHRWASFLVGGGAHRQTRVELVLAETGEVIFEARGQNRENMRRVVVDLKPYLGKTIFIRIVDQHSGPWGHINFDDFRFHERQPKTATARNPFPYSGLPAERAAAVMTLPEGFEVRVFAAEPDVRQPIAFTIDERGRLWVVEAYSYPIRQPEGKGKDRILIFTDRDGDGRYDERKVFIENLNLVSGIEVGFGGVWVGAAPYLLFIPDRDRDDVPDGEPQIVLDGWGYQDTHETLNAFIWGPDGWLYGCHGVFTHSQVGKPGDPPEKRQRLNAALWRYHPVKDRFEVFAYGTSNPWGVDFDDFGQAFMTACVIPHLYHVIQGARYQRQAGSHFNPYIYDDIKTIADHLHYTGAIQEHAHWGHEPVTPAAVAAAGGGHAHAGAMIYLGDTWPEKFRGKLFMNNIHGARINMDILQRRGSGFIGRHGPDFLITNDYWSQMLYLRYGPDGHVFVNDWYDRNQCHRTDPNVHDRSNGRIYKIVYRPREVPRYEHPLYQRLIEEYRVGKLDLARLTDEELVELQLHPNDWYVRTARRLLQERAAEGTLSGKAVAQLEELALRHEDPRRRLRALWTLHACGALSDATAQRLLQDPNEYVRAWIVQLKSEDTPVSQDWLRRFEQLAEEDSSAVVRLYVASAAQRIEPSRRWNLMRALLSHDEDADDHNLPYMYWFAWEPLVAADPPRALETVRGCRIPHVVQLTYRRVADLGTLEAYELLSRELARDLPIERVRWILAAVRRSLEGKRRAQLPPTWPEVSERLLNHQDGAIRQLALAIAVTFGDPAALERLRRTLGDRTQPEAARLAALNALERIRDEELPRLLLHIVRSERGQVRREAIRALGSFGADEIAETLIDIYAGLSRDERRAALAVLTTRRSWAQRLLDAIQSGKIPRQDLTADLVRQLQNVADEAMAARLRKIWGIVRRSPEEKRQLMERYRKLLTDRSLPPPDVNLGRTVFAKTCQQCHKLFGVGGDVGPDLTGSNRADLDYALSNVVDPSAVMARDYMPYVILTTEGRVITGIVKRQTERTVTVRTADEELTLPRDEIEFMRPSDQSMMPDDLLQQLTPHEIRSLFAYLASPTQVAPLATADIAAELAEDLGHWTGTAGAWRIERGHLIGTVPDGGEAVLMSDVLFADVTIRFDFEVPEEASLWLRLRWHGQGGYELGLAGTEAGLLRDWAGRGILQRASLASPRTGRIEVVLGGRRTVVRINGETVIDLTDAAAEPRGAVGFRIQGRPGVSVRISNLRFELGQPTAAREP